MPCAWRLTGSGKTRAQQQSRLRLRLHMADVPQTWRDSALLQTVKRLAHRTWFDGSVPSGIVDRTQPRARRQPACRASVGRRQCRSSQVRRTMLGAGYDNLGGRGVS